MKIFLRFHLILGIFLTLALSQNINASGNNNGSIIIDNSGVTNANGIMTNLRTGSASDPFSRCSKNDALDINRCNSFNTNKIMVLQNNSSGGIQAHIGTQNNQAIADEKKGTSEQLNFFTQDEHLFDLDHFREAAQWLSQRDENSQYLGRTGDLSWQQFINQVATGETLYGIVRVRVPLVKSSELDHDDDDDRDEKEDKDDHDRDHSDNNEKHDSDKSQHSSKLSKKSMSRSLNHEQSSKKNKKEHYELEDDDDADDESHQQRTDLCGCRPSKNTNLEPGETICGKKLSQQAKISVKGSLLIDFVKCDQHGDSIPLSQLNQDSHKLYFKVNIPILINPAVSDNQGAMSQLTQIKNLMPAVSDCSSLSNCVLPVNQTIPYQLVDAERKADFLYRTGQNLSASIFSQLSQASQFQLTLPSGYTSAWQEALSKLNISIAQWKYFWRDYYPSKTNIETGDHRPFTQDDIRSNRFIDLPAYMYSGGLVDMHSHVNISGLVYVPQALELEQAGYVTLVNKPVENNKPDDDDAKDKNYSDDDDHKEKKQSSHKSLSKRSSESHANKEKNDDDKSDDDDNKDQCGKKEGDDDDHSDDDDSKSKQDHKRKSSSLKRSSEKNTDDKKHDSEKSDDDDHKDSDQSKPCVKKILSPAMQYIRGAIIVRDAFYIEANKGITLLSNDPDSYSDIPLSDRLGMAGRFKPFRYQSSNNNNGDSNSPGGTNNPNTPGGGAASQNGSEWIEIRAQ